MVKKSILIREKKRQIIIKNFFEKRQKLKFLLKNTTKWVDKIKIYKKLSKLPRDSAKVRSRNRCWKTGRARGYYRFFGLCRNFVREFSHQGFFPGIIKSSW